jgi:GNAT superfamily N-acetyltransferase
MDCSKEVEPMIYATASVDTDQLGASYELWAEWTREDHDHNLDTAGWWRNAMVLAQSGAFMPIIAWDGLKPIGMVELYINYDPAARKMFAHGDHAFVREEYRGERVFRVLYDAIEACARFMGANEFVAPVGLDGPGPFLKDFYERQGFESRGLIMRRAA